MQFLVKTIWPWVKICALEEENKVLREDNRTLADSLNSLTDRDASGRFVKKAK
jgi:hypothetical protein